MGRLSTILVGCASLSASLAASPDDIPPLRPPIKGLAPGFWESHGSQVLLAAVGLLLVLGAVLLVLCRKKKPVPIVPGEQARAALREAREKNPRDLASISQATRRGLAGMLGLPQWEMTTSEFCAALDEHLTKSGVSSDLPGRARSFLLRCDTLKFARESQSSPWDSAGEALELLDLAEQSRQAAHREGTSK